MLDTCRQLEREGFEVTYLSPEADGLIDLKIQSRASSRYNLASIMPIMKLVCLKQDIKAHELCRANKTIFHVDATSVGIVEIISEELAADLMSMFIANFTGQKVLAHCRRSS